MLLLDTDAASVLAKGELVEELLELFENHAVHVTPEVEAEHEKPFKRGYVYPGRILERIDTLAPDVRDREIYRDWLDDGTVDHGELEATAVAINRGAIFFTMDRAAADYARERGVLVLTFDNFAKLLLERDIIDDESLDRALRRIDERDNR